MRALESPMSIRRWAHIAVSPRADTVIVVGFISLFICLFKSSLLALHLEELSIYIGTSDFLEIGKQIEKLLGRKNGVNRGEHSFAFAWLWNDMPIVMKWDGVSLGQ